MDKKSFFITLEGIEGVGKSSHVNFVCDLLANHYIESVKTRETGGTPIAERIRQILLNHDTEHLTLQAELLLLFAARAQNLEHVIKPALAKGKWVVCDRFTDTTYAYQGGGRQLPMAEIAMLEQAVQKNLRPDLILLLDAPVEIALSRLSGRGKPDRIERENYDFFERARQVYLQRAKQFPDIYRVIDASKKSLELVRNQIKEVLETFIASHDENTK